jgi:spoIIIJ-associated protein
MEWVQTTGRTVAEAKEAALDQLGVAEDDAEFEILDEPRAGLFGRVRGEARVRARVRPTTPRAKTERRDRKKPEPAAVGVAGAAAPPAAAASGNGSRARRPSSPPPRSSSSEAREPREPREPRPQGDPVDPKAVGEQAVAFLDGLVEAFGLQGVSTLRQDGEDLEVTVDGQDLGILVGPRGATLLAIQDVTRVASQRRLGDHSTHLRVDIADYRAKRRDALTRFTQKIVDEVVASGTAQSLGAMPSSDRKIVHDAVAAADGVTSRSEGEEPNRRVVIVPAAE